MLDMPVGGASVALISSVPVLLVGGVVVGAAVGDGDDVAVGGVVDSITSSVLVQAVRTAVIMRNAQIMTVRINLRFTFCVLIVCLSINEFIASVWDYPCLPEFCQCILIYCSAPIIIGALQYKGVIGNGRR